MEEMEQTEKVLWEKQREIQVGLGTERKERRQLGEEVEEEKIKKYKKINE